MKSVYSLLLSLLLWFTFNTSSVMASHIVASDMSYTCTATPNVYSVTIRLYRDCSGFAQICAACPSSLSPSCTLPISITGASNIPNSGMPSQTCSGVSFGTQNLTVVTSQSAFDVVSLCKLSTSICNNCGTRTAGTYTPGIEIFTFTGQINLASVPSSCCLINLGYQTCCRNNGITTIQNPNSLNFYSELIINRCATPCNSSPGYDVSPDFVMSSGYDVNLRYGNLIDPDGDSLSYEMAQSLIAPQTPVPYMSPYSATVPFPYLGAPAQRPPALSPLGLGFDKTTGVMSFRPYGPFVAPVVVAVYQWKKVAGVTTLMGVTRRDHMIFSQSITPSLEPVFKIYDANGVMFTPIQWGRNTDTVCLGQNKCFTLVAKDDDAADTTYMRLANNDSIMGNYSITRLYNNSSRNINGPRQDSVRFCFTPPASGGSGPFYMNVFASDNHCPIIGRSTLSYGYYVKAGYTATISKQYLDTFRYSFRYSLSGSASKDTANFWEIETTPGSGVFTSYKTDSVINKIFPLVGLYRIKLNAFSACGVTTYTDSVTITSLSLQLVSKKNLACKLDSNGYIKVNAMGGKAPYLFKINTSAFAASDSFINLKAGSYVITIKDSMGISIAQTIVLSQPANLMSVATTVQNILCNGDSTGRVTVNALNATSPVLYSIDSMNYVSSNVFQNLKPGSYKVWATDSNTCSKSASFTITQPNLLSMSTPAITHIKCKGSATGNITLYGSGGISPYTYRKDSGSYISSPVFLNLPAGTYLFEIKDQNNCKKNASYTLKEPDSALSFEVSIVPHGCPLSTSSGSALFKAKGGTRPYLYGYNGGPQPTAFNPVQGLGAGNYNFLVKDSNNCTATKITTVPHFSTFNSQPVVTNASCAGSNDGSVTFSPQIGTPPYTYYMSSQNKYYGNRVLGLGFGSYTFTLTDSNGCNELVPVIISQAAPTTLSFTVNKPSCATLANGSVMGTPNGGKAPYQYTWSTTPVQNGPQAMNVPAGWLKLQLRDSSLCITKDSVLVLAKTVFQDEEICAVTHDTNHWAGYPIIIWNKTPDMGTAAFDLKVSNGTNTTLLGTKTWNGNPFWIDTLVAALYGNQSTYTLYSADSCGTRSNASLPHRPAKITLSSFDSVPHFSIQPYLGPLTVTSYYVYRKTTGTYQLIDSIPVSQTTYADVSWPHTTSAYILQLRPGAACMPIPIYSNPLQVLNLGISSQAIYNAGFTVYPNPSAGNITVQCKGRNCLMTRIEIRSLSGALVHSKTLENPQDQYMLNLDQLANGSYLIQVWNTDGGSGTLPLIINK